MDMSDARRDAIHEFLQEAGPPEESIPGALLTGWTIVTEWMDTKGNKWLTKGHSASLTNWNADGFHHEALYGNWEKTNE